MNGSNFPGSIPGLRLKRRGAREAGRKHERTEFAVKIRIVSHGACETQYYEGLCIDLSETGVAFLTEADLNMRDVLELTFENNGQPQFRMYARLSYRLGPRYGAYFTQAE